MAFHERSFEVHVVLGSPSAVPWVDATWNKISAALDPVMDAARDRPAIRTDQCRPGAGSPNQRGIRFGRIGWNAQGFNKWVHAKDGMLISGSAAEFGTCEVWAPSWTVCQRERVAPDVFFAIRREPNRSPMRFGSVCLLAVASDLGSSVADQGRQSAS